MKDHAETQKLNALLIPLILPERDLLSFILVISVLGIKKYTDLSRVVRSREQIDASIWEPQIPVQLHFEDRWGNTWNSSQGHSSLGPLGSWTHLGVIPQVQNMALE